MPVLSNWRQERFARNIAKGMSQSQAYIKAGYKASTPNVKWSGASRLLRVVKVNDRVMEILSKDETKLRVTRNSMTNLYAELVRDAKSVGNMNAAKGLADSLAKLHGLMVERQESGAPGDFSRMDDDQLREYVEAAITEAGSGYQGEERADEEGEDAGC